MNTLFTGLATSLAYGALCFFVLTYWGSASEARLFVAAYTTSFRTLISLGLILGTALVIFRSQNLIPVTIEAAFTETQLRKTAYHFHKARFVSTKRSVTFAAEFVVAAFVIFSYARFPLPRTADAMMIAAVCAEYSLGVYVGRKLCYAGMMLHSLLSAPISRNLFKGRELDDINSYVHVVSTLTVIFVYVHVAAYYNGPFLYNSFLGKGIKPFLALPAIIATPVLLIFNFYPRAVLRKLYGASIDVELEKLQKVLQNEKLSTYEKRSYSIAFDRMSRDELRYSLQLSLSDLPIVITILIMVLQPLLTR